MFDLFRAQLLRNIETRPVPRLSIPLSRDGDEVDFCRWIVKYLAHIRSRMHQAILYQWSDRESKPLLQSGKSDLAIVDLLDDLRREIVSNATDSQPGKVGHRRQNNEPCHQNSYTGLSRLEPALKPH